MRKMRWIALVALTLAAVMALSSCALFGGKKGDVTKLIDKDKTFESDATVLTRTVQVNALTDMDLVDNRGDLAYFADGVEVDDAWYTKHVVYNLATGNVVFEKTENKTTDIDVTLAKTYFDYEQDDYAYMTVTTTTWKLDEFEARTGDGTKRSALLDALGNTVAEATGDVDVEEIADLLYFDGKCYRFAEDGKLENAFEFAALGKMPEITDYSEKYYMAIEDARVVIYDKQLKFVSACDIPAYAELIGGCMLPNGKVLLQYEYELDEDAKKYDYIRETETEVKGGENYTIDRLGKFDLTTLLVNPKNGKAKEIKCDYVMYVAIGAQHTYVSDFFAINFEKVEALAMGYKIEDKRVADGVEYALTIDKSGKVSPLLYNGERVDDVRMVANDRFVIETEEREYLVDGKGKLIGEVTNGSFFGEYILCDGKVFDMDLATVYDLNEKKLELVKRMENALLLTNADDDVLLYTGKGEPAVLAVAEDGETLYKYTNTYVIVHTEDGYALYAQDGTKVTNFGDDGALSEVATTEGAILFKTTEEDEDGYKTVYYRVSE